MINDPQAAIKGSAGLQTGCRADVHVRTLDRLNQLLAESGQEPLPAPELMQFSNYISLIIRWNSKTNLTAVRDEDGILSRHFIESIAVTRELPKGIGTLLDFGSGAGLPGIPIAICLPKIAVTLAESQGKKAAFLQEAVRVLGINARVHPGRAELLRGAFDCVTLRAVDRMAEAVAAAAPLVASGGWLALMTTQVDLPQLQSQAGTGFTWPAPIPLPGSDQRLLAFGQRTDH